MSCTACRAALALLLLAAAALAPPDARACTASSQDSFTVGNKSTDSSCNFDSIQDAIYAATCPAGTRIYITPERTYAGQHLIVQDKNISLIGRGTGTKCNTLVAACGIAFPCPTHPLLTLNGGSGSLIQVRGTSTVLVQYLTLTGASNGGNGGGIDFQGNGTLTLATSSVESSTASSGGGINFQGNGDVTLDHSTVEDNTAASGYGGGIRYDGAGTLTLTNTVVSGNTAGPVPLSGGDNPGYGGGISLKGDGGDATLVIGANTQLVENTANGQGGAGAGGGAIRLDGAATLEMTAAGSWIYANHAPYGNGGGILMVDGTAHIGAVAYAQAPLIYQNDALNGGGLAIFATPSYPGDAEIFAVDPTHPVRIEANRATSKGGALYVKSYYSSSDQRVASANLGGVRIDDNAAPDGAAIYADFDSSSGYTLGGQVSIHPGYCAAGVDCNTVSDNNSLDATFLNPTNGATIVIRSSAKLDGRSFRMSGNHGGYAIWASGDYAGLTLADCLLAANTTGAELLRADSGVYSYIERCTFAYNTIGAAQAMVANGNFTLIESIISQPSIDAVSHGAGFTANNIVADDATGLPFAADIVEADPLFVDKQHGDFRLLVAQIGAGIVVSPAVDFALTTDANLLDIAGRPRDQDVGAQPNRYGPRDLGAYEMQPISDRVFGTGFGDPLLWAF